MRLKSWHCLSLLIVAVLFAYYPSLSAGYNSIDDLKMISSIDEGGPLNIGQLFLPRGTAQYYRPLTVLSYFIDRDAWDSHVSFMHLENILLHLGCALLIFALTRRLLPLWGGNGLWPALFAGLFFALHPLATESVCWISGRTDPLMTLFILLSVWLIILALERASVVFALSAGVVLCLAGLAKEVAVFVLPGMLWLITVYPGQGGWFSRCRQRWLTLLMPTAGVAVYFTLRHLATAQDTGIDKAVQGVVAGDYDLLNKVRVAFKVYGFYFKKLFVPWPLNFGIIEISGWYVLLGVMLAGLLLYLVWRADIAGAFGLMAFCVLSPALMVVFGKMTWTPLAERYLYASVALFAPLSAYMLLRCRACVAVPNRRRFDLALILLLLVFFGTTLHRSWIWQDNLRLYRDTVAKSPELDAAKLELASALLRRGEAAEAEELLAGLQKGESPSDFIKDDLNLALIKLTNGDPEQARALLLPHLDSRPKEYYDLLQSLLRINDQRIGRADTWELRSTIQAESLAWLQEQQSLRPSAFTLYRIGKMQLSMGDNAAALNSFKTSLTKAPADAHYRGAAEKLVKRLEGL